MNSIDIVSLPSLVSILYVYDFYVTWNYQFFEKLFSHIDFSRVYCLFVLGSVHKNEMMNEWFWNGI